MLPKERAPALGMAAQTVLVRRGLNQLCWIGTSVRVMATGASDFALAVRHMRGTLQLRSAHLMALQAQLRLRFLRADVFSQRLTVPLIFSGRIRQRDITLGNTAIV